MWKWILTRVDIVIRALSFPGWNENEELMGIGWTLSWILPIPDLGSHKERWDVGACAIWCGSFGYLKVWDLGRSLGYLVSFALGDFLLLAQYKPFTFIQLSMKCWGFRAAVFTPQSFLSWKRIIPVTWKIWVAQTTQLSSKGCLLVGLRAGVGCGLKRIIRSTRWGGIQERGGEVGKARGAFPAAS